MSQSTEFLSDESRFAQLQRIQPCLRTCGRCFQHWYTLSEHICWDTTHHRSAFFSCYWVLPWAPVTGAWHPAFYCHFGEHRKILHCYVWPLALLNLFFAFATVWQTSFTTISSSTFESVNLSAPIQYRAKRQPRYFPNGMQYSTRKKEILDFVFRGRGNWKLYWISQFDPTSTCTYWMANLKRPNLK